jgi:hypothetical protein
MVNALRVVVVSLVLAIVFLACNGILGIDQAFPDNGGSDAGACGTYCAAVLQNCPNADYLDFNTCLSICPAFEPGLASDTKGDTLGCRTYYANAAATDKTKCEAAGALGGGVCTSADPCVTFCEIDTTVCTGPYAAYDGGADCVGQCQSNFDTYLTDAGNDLQITDDSNTINCRAYHLQAALAPPEPADLLAHCPHTTVASFYCHQFYDGPPP